MCVCVCVCDPDQKSQLALYHVVGLGYLEA